MFSGRSQRTSLLGKRSSHSWNLNSSSLKRISILGGQRLYASAVICQKQKQKQETNKQTKNTENLKSIYWKIDFIV